jgi:protocatechuate 3,4-dioxygenase beta subunit
MNTKPIGRRQAIALIGAAAGAALAAGCSDSPTSPTPSATGAGPTPPPTGNTNAACVVTPSETAGPFPSLSNLVRSDVREDRSGTPLILTVRVVDASSACAPVSNASVEIWQCDAEGSYSEYGSERAETYLRGVQTTNSAGEVTFTTIYPGWYQGRATHIHLEVTINGVSRKVTQMAFPETVNNAVHTSGVYSTRGRNPMSNSSDGIFADSLSSEIVTPSGDPTSGYSVTFQVGI